MAKLKPIDNSDYTQLLMIIFNGKHKQKEIRDIFIPSVSQQLKRTKPHDSPSNLSMKLQQLRFLGLIRVEGKNKHAKNYINYSGIMKAIIFHKDYMAHDNKKSIYDEAFSRIKKKDVVSERKNLELEQQLINNSFIHEMLEDYFSRVFKMFLADLPSLKKLIHNFLMGIALKNSLSDKPRPEGVSSEEFREFLLFRQYCKAYAFSHSAPLFKAIDLDDDDY